jgi:hypothetical protein
MRAIGKQMDNLSIGADEADKEKIRDRLLVRHSHFSLMFCPFACCLSNYLCIFDTLFFRCLTPLQPTLGLASVLHTKANNTITNNMHTRVHLRCFFFFPLVYNPLFLLSTPPPPLLIFEVFVIRGLDGV